ncbi:hypothetical protein [Streptomyces sp. HUAS TT7]|uniref:hypothetical protein n=1 Tax=Streptomyces sp. HUAS TT7 TaxID=3447507 RepID=UPI003F65FA30
MQWRTLAVGAAAGLLSLAGMSTGQSAPGSFVGPLHTVDTIASTVPANGDVNPYGVAVVPEDRGSLRQGSVLVSNFNAASNLQGTGTTIVQISPSGAVSTFARIDPAHLPGPCPGGVGLTTALVVLRSGWVVMGSLPTTDGTSATARAGCLIVLDSHGRARQTLAGYGINGPWDMTVRDGGDYVDLFVTNVLNGTLAGSPATVRKGTVLRLGAAVGDDTFQLRSVTRIGSGFAERTDPAALVVGPTGVGLGRDGTLYVADSVDNRITAIPHALTRPDSAGTGQVITTGGNLNTPLGLAVAPGGDILTVNAGDGNLVETTPSGTQIAVRTLDSSGTPPGAGALFGLAVRPGARAVYFVDDATNTLDILH